MSVWVAHSQMKIITDELKTVGDKKRNKNVAIISFLIVISWIQDAKTSFVRVYAKMKLALNYKIVNVWRNNFAIRVRDFLIKILSGFASSKVKKNSRQYTLLRWAWAELK